MNNNTTVEPKNDISWKEIFKLSLTDLPTLASRVNKLTKECEQLIK